MRRGMARAARVAAWWIALVAWSVCAPAAGAAVKAAHALLISVDGLRADAVTPELAPRLSQLMARGTWAKGRCEEPSVTVPNHVSMVTGLTPQHHGFLLNRREDYPPGTYVPRTMLDVAHAAGRTTGLYVSKEKLRILARPESLTREVVTETGSSDAVVAAFLQDLAASSSGGWDLTVMHLVEPDFTGHAKGWMSRGYKQAVRTIDADIGRIVDALEERHALEQTLVLITADHGGMWSNHRLNVPAVRNVPWIAVGPPGLPAANAFKRTPGPCDILPTVLGALGLPIPDGLDGSAVW